VALAPDAIATRNDPIISIPRRENEPRLRPLLGVVPPSGLNGSLIETTFREILPLRAMTQRLPSSLTQDENWGENSAAVMGSSHNFSGDFDGFGFQPSTTPQGGIRGRAAGRQPVAPPQEDEYDDDDAEMAGEKWGTSGKVRTDRGLAFHCRRHTQSFVTGLVALAALASPVIMVALPSLDVLHLREQQMLCSADCDGALVALAFKLFVLAAGSWAVFVRPSRASLPRVRLYRAAVAALVVATVAAFWLFYVAHLARDRELVKYRGLVGFATSLADSLLLIHYLAVLLLELRHRAGSGQFYLKAVRSPDGASRSWPAGPMSVQQAAAWVLDRYYTEFPVYNPYLDRMVHPAGAASGVRGSRRGIKVYDIDGHGGNINVSCMTHVNGFQ